MITKATGRPPGRPRKVKRPRKGNQTAAEVVFNTARSASKKDFEYLVFKIFPSGSKPFLGLILQPTPEAIGGMFGGGNFEILKRCRSTQATEGSAVRIDVHPSKYPEKYFDPAMTPTTPQAQPFNPWAQPQPGQPWPGMPPGYAPGYPPGWPPAGRVEDDDEDDDEILELKAEVRRLKQAGEARERDLLVQQLAEIKAAMATGGKSNMTEMIEVARLISGPPKPAMDLPQLIAMGSTLMSGFFGFVQKAVETKASTEPDFGKEMLGQLMTVASGAIEAYKKGSAGRVIDESGKEQPPAPAADPAAAQAAAEAEIKAAAEEKEKEMAFLKLGEELNRRFTEGEAPAAVAKWLYDQAGPGWDFVKAQIRAFPEAMLVEFAKSFDKDLTKSEAKQKWIKGVAAVFKNDLPKPA